MPTLSDEQIRRLKGYLALKKGDINQATMLQIVELFGILLSQYQQAKGDKGDSVKGDKGDMPTKEEVIKILKPFIPAPLKGDPGDDGKDYILTDKDKKQIAKSIDVPVVEKIVEKVEVVKPMIREIAFSDTPEQIVKKLKTLKDAWLDISKVKGLQELLDESGQNLLTQVRGFVPNAFQSLYDVQIENPIDGQAVVWNANKRKWVAGAVVSSSVGTGFTKEVPSGAVDGSNQDFVFVTKPTYLVVDHSWYLENNGWTWSGSTATTTIPPQSDIWGFK